MKKLIQLTTITLLILITFSSFFLNSQAQTANWWDSSWQYRKQVTIFEQSNFSLEDFPVSVTFEHSNKITTNGSDIRLIDGNSEIPYSIDKINATYATIVFNINLNADGSKTIYIYYGNPQALPPNYPLISLEITEGNVGNAIIDDRVYIGWKNSVWGVKPGSYMVGGNIVYIDNNAVTLWTDFRLDSNQNGEFEESEDMLTDFDAWIGGIGRAHLDLGNYVERSYGIGDFQSYKRTPNYVDLVFAGATLRVYKGQTFVETTQADRLQIESTSWDYASYQGSTEQNIIDGANTNGVFNDPSWNILYSSKNNPGWLGLRNSMTGSILGTIAFGIDSTYAIRFQTKEAHAFDRVVLFDYKTTQTQDPYDQPASCKIYWYADNSNMYTNLAKTAAILSNPPQLDVALEEKSSINSPDVPEIPILTVVGVIVIVLLGVMVVKRRPK
jgi:hypothetical protein